MSQPAHLAEIQEQDLPPAAAAIFAEIRSFMGIPMPALIWRHLATRPGALAWIWPRVRPVLASGALPRAATRLPLDHLPVLDRFDRRALRVLGLDGDAEAGIRRVLGFYNRTNPINLIVVHGLLALLEGRAGAAAAPLEGAPPPPPTGDLPAPLAVEQMPAEQAELVLAIGCWRGMAGPRLVPTLYRHLAPWPAFLALAGVQLLPRLHDGAVDRAARGLAAGAEPVIAQFASAFANAPATPPAPPDLAGALAPFARVIPEMVVIGHMLQHALPPD